MSSHFPRYSCFRNAEFAPRSECMKKDLHTHVAFTNNDQFVFYDDSLGNGLELKYFKGGREVEG